MLRRGSPWVLVLVLLGVLLVRGKADEPAASAGSVTGRVVRVVDGDTAVVAVPGNPRERVRYIGIDTPEDVKPNTPVQCFSRRAAARNAQLVEGRRVRLRFDVERRDRYGRLLAYVYTRPPASPAGDFVNARLVDEGYARAYPYPPNTAHAGEFARLAHRAAAAGRGLWSRC